MLNNTLQKIGSWILDRNPLGILIVSSYMAIAIMYSVIVIAHRYGYSDILTLFAVVLICTAYAWSFLFVYAPCYETHHKADTNGQ
jgi:hypothetical protein